MNKNAPVILVGGGTGGHVTPLIALGEELIAHNRPFLFVGEQGGREELIIREQRWQFVGIKAGKWRRYWSWQAIRSNLGGLVRFCWGFCQSIGILLQTKAPIVISKGGYVALPMVLAAYLLRRRIFIHESDAVMGLANRLSARLATRVYTGFPVTCYPQANSKYEFVGIPIRRVLLKAATASRLSKARPLILVIGGSQGSKAINHLVWEALPKILLEADVVHIVGEANEQAAREFFSTLSDKQKNHYKYFGYTKRELAYYFAMADVLISRASATVLAEAGVFSRATLSIPLPNSAGDHQLANAKQLNRAGAVRYVEQKDLTAERLVEEIMELIGNPSLREQLGESLNKYFHSENATSKILKDIL